MSSSRRPRSTRRWQAESSKCRRQSRRPAERRAARARTAAPPRRGSRTTSTAAGDDLGELPHRYTITNRTGRARVRVPVVAWTRRATSRWDWRWRPRACTSSGITRPRSARTRRARSPAACACRPRGAPSSPGTRCSGARRTAPGAASARTGSCARSSPSRASFHASHPRAPRLLVGDLSRPHGGDFGPRFGYIGHASHQNGLDVDVYYPRADRRELAPRDARDIDRGLSQELVDRFLAAGAAVIFVGPNTGAAGSAREGRAAGAARQPPACAAAPARRTTAVKEVSAGGVPINASIRA